MRSEKKNLCAISHWSRAFAGSIICSGSAPRRLRFAGNPPNDADPALGLGFDGRGAL
jgi:hypothetical protein